MRASTLCVVGEPCPQVIGRSSVLFWLVDFAHYMMNRQVTMFRESALEE